MAASDTYCAGCDMAIENEVSSDRKPCAACGSLARRYSLSATLSGTATLRPELEVKRYPDALLDTARRLIDTGEFGIATVVVHMACEVAADLAFSQAYSRAGLVHLQEPVGGLLNGFNLANDKIRQLYNAVAGEAIESLPFWQDFKASAGRRNAIMHKGDRATSADAEASVRAGAALVRHLGTVGDTTSAA